MDACGWMDGWMGISVEIQVLVSYLDSDIWLGLLLEYLIVRKGIFFQSFLSLQGIGGYYRE